MLTLEDDIVAQIEEFALKRAANGHTTKLYGRETAIRRACVNNPTVSPATVKRKFDEILAAMMTDELIAPAERQWLQHLVGK